MIHMLFLFPRTADPETLDDFLTNRFIPQNKGFEGLRSLKVSTGNLMSPHGPPPYAKVVEATFDSLDDIMAIAQSPETKAMRDEGEALGVLILMYEATDA